MSEARNERALAGAVIGVLLSVTGLAAAGFLALPGSAPAAPGLVGGAAAAAIAAGVACLAIAVRGRAPAAATHAPTLATLVLVGLLMHETAGLDSPFRFYLAFVIAFAAYFFAPRIAVAYLVLSACTAATPLLLDGAETEEIRSLAVLLPTFALLGAALMAGRRLRVSLTDEAASLAREQAALRRVATAVAAGSPPHAVFALVSAEALRLVPGAVVAGIVKFDRPESATLVGAWGDHAHTGLRIGDRIPVHEPMELARLRRTSRAIRVDEPRGDNDALTAQLGYRASVIVPIHAHGELWGALGVGSRTPGCWDGGTERRLVDFAELLTTSIAETEDRAALTARAGLDPLTGLANHRTLQERLREEISRAIRHGRPLALAIVDVDRFKEVNRKFGHETGDKVLREVAARLKAVVRDEDVLARVGGDEFAFLLPESDRHTAFAVLERARRLIASEPFCHRARLTISTGICDVHTAAEPDAMYRLADGALYWSKVQGRDVTWIYDPQVVRELSAHERAEQLERSQALLGLRALARAIDAKDPSTREHSERVARLASQLAEAAGWPRRRIAELHEAALVHDVGKIGIPDAILLKPGRLARGEYEAVKEHAELGARIVSEVLSPEQVRWVHCHHERPDGLGYPAGLDAARIPDGAALLAMADCWDVMTSTRSYSAPMPIAGAMAECRMLAGRQFTAEAVRALEALYARGALADPAGGLVSVNAA